MPSTEVYEVSGSLSIQDMENKLNSILSQISNRIDAIEGIRGTSTIQVGMTVKNTSGEIVHGFNTSEEV